MSIEAFPEFARDNWESIRELLLSGSYQPLPVKRVEIPKPTGGMRPLGIPTVIDRLIQQAIAQVLMPIFDPGFSEFSYGFRPGRSAHDAVYKVREYVREGCRIVVDMDLSKFFDMVNHDVLMHRVAKRVRDKSVLRLIGKYLRAGERVMASIKRFLERKLKLKVNEEKSQVAPVDRITFLGFTFKGGKIRRSDRLEHIDQLLEVFAACIVQ